MNHKIKSNVIVHLIAFFFGTICAILRRLLEIDCLMSWIATFLEIEWNFLIYRWAFQNIKTFSIFLNLYDFVDWVNIYTNGHRRFYIVSHFMKDSIEEVKNYDFNWILVHNSLVELEYFKWKHAHKNPNDCMLTPKNFHTINSCLCVQIRDL